ncbi:MAG: metal-dependent hydrolase [Gammaproteobacteria bacterium]
MATLNIHAGAAMSLCGLSATSLLVADLASVKEVTLYFALGTVGGLLPDLDSDHSRSLRVGFFLVSLLAAFSTVFGLATRLTLAELVAVWMGVFVGIRYAVLWIFTRLTSHRGLFHSLPAAFFCGFTTAAVAHHYFALSGFTSWMAGAYVSLGYVVHLILDEVYSIDLGGVKVKRSFGTALKLYSRQSWRLSILLYGATALAFHLAPDLHTVSKVIVDDQAYQHILDRLIPTGGWFTSVSGPIGINPR